MAFNALIPQATDQEAQSQAQLLANFAEVSAFVSVNHTAFNGVDQGKHRFITLPLQTIVPAPAPPPPAPQPFPPATSANEFSIYNAVNGAGNRALWLRKTNLAGVITGDIDITTLTYNVGTFEGSAALPCGLIMKWGYSGVGVTDRDIVFTTAFPTDTINIQVTPHFPGVGNHGYDLYVTHIDRTHFTLHWHNTFPAYWFALGY